MCVKLGTCNFIHKMKTSSNLLFILVWKICGFRPKSYCNKVAILAMEILLWFCGISCPVYCENILDLSLRGWSSYKSFELWKYHLFWNIVVIMLTPPSSGTIISNASYAWWKEIWDIVMWNKWKAWWTAWFLGVINSLSVQAHSEVNKGWVER